MLNPCFKQGEIVFVRARKEEGHRFLEKNFLYLAVVQDHYDGALVPVVVFREYARGERDAHLVFALNLSYALWTFTGFVEQPCHALK